MDTSQLSREELLAWKLELEQRIAGYRDGMSTVKGRCSKSSLSGQIDKCEMELEEIRTRLGEI
jgi:hypothetical protein